MLTFIGLGLDNEGGITLKGLEIAKQADLVLAELYTSLMPNLSINNLEKLIQKPLVILDRHAIEENAQQTILDHAKSKRVALLVPGDPMVATTHIDLRLRAEKQGIPTRVVAAASIQTVGALVGLQSYKFGRTITLPFLFGAPAESPYDYLKKNLQASLHTLILLDLNVEKREFMTAGDGIRYLAGIEEKRKEKVFQENTLTIAIARAGADDMIIQAGTAKQLQRRNIGSPPHCLIVPTKLHFMEAEALRILAKAEVSNTNQDS